MMKVITYIAISFCCLFYAEKAIAAGPFSISSPDNNIVFTFYVKGHTPMYSVLYKKQALIKNSQLQLLFDDGNGFENTVITNKPAITKGIDDYSLIVGKTSYVHDSYNTATISLSGKYMVNIEVKVFNDGVAFRYSFPLQKKNSFVLHEERTAFNVAGDPVIKALMLPNYTTSHEGLYSTMPVSKIVRDTLMDMPAMFQFKDNVYMAVTEAALLDYACMYLTMHSGKITGILSPLPGQQVEKVKATFPHVSPWRVLLISDRPGALIESNIVTSLNAPCTFNDTSWIQPGLTTFPWWNGTIIPDTSFSPGNNFETNKYYIDFCAANNIRYHTIVEYGGHEWYRNEGYGYQPSGHVDVTDPVDGLDMKALCEYAHQRHVGIRVWVHWKALYPVLDKAFAVFEKWGLSGMMVDFMDRDDQEMVNIQTEILQKAAAHHLHIQFHGAYKPTGLSRTYPNEFTREGTLNYENDKWNNLVTPDADLNIVFTRLLAGSTDYHLGGFRAMPADKFKVQYTRPFVMGTRCHMLAMYVVLESYQGMMCDYPEAYIGQPGFELLQRMPVTWDETKVPAAKMDEYVAIARRKGETWYVGAITNNSSRSVKIDCSFLPAGNYKALIYQDGPAIKENANDLVKKEISVTNASAIELPLAAGGGSVVVISRQ